MSRNITLEQAENIIEACKVEANSIGQPMNIAVVDDSANLVAFVAMDDTKLIGEDISQKKALTAVYFQTDTRDLVPLVQPGAPLYGIESTTGGRLVVVDLAEHRRDDLTNRLAHRWPGFTAVAMRRALDRVGLRPAAPLSVPGPLEVRLWSGVMPTPPIHGARMRKPPSRRPENALALKFARNKSAPATVTVRSVVISCHP